MRDLTTLKMITEDWEDSRRDVANKICRKLIKIADKKDKEIEDFTLRDIKDALLLREGEYLTTSKGFMKVVLNIIKEIYLSLGVVIDYKIEDFTDIISDELQGFYVKSEIIDICNLFINVQDKLIIYGLFVGMNKDDLVNLKREDLDFKALQERNPDIYAWIEVPGTKVDYPIVQHPTDNTYYLTHTIDHKEATAASIYTETYNSTDFEDHLTVIYGHNMKNGSMFRTLHNFENYDFFEENREIIIYLPEQTRHYEIFAAYTYDNRHLLHTYYCEEPDSFEKYLDEVFAIKDMGAYIDHDIEVTGEDYVITLSTCVNSGNSSQRYLVQAVLVSIDQ